MDDFSFVQASSTDVTRNARGAPRARARPVTASQLIQGEVKEMNQGADQETVRRGNQRAESMGDAPEPARTCRHCGHSI